MKTRVLQTELFVAQPIDKVFAFFSDAYNLDVLTPPWLHFRFVTPRPIAMQPGTIIDYQLRLHGIPVRWRTEITVWQPPQRFVDEQRQGPYRLWRHEHTFEAVAGGTHMRDRVQYEVPGGLLEPVLHALLVGPDVRKIFAYRTEKIREIFAAGA